MARVSTKTEAEKAAAVAEKATRFKTVGQARTAKALDAISTIANCANKNTYTWTEEQIAKIEAALKAEVEKTVAAFRAPGGVVKAGIEL